MFVTEENGKDPSYPSAGQCTNGYYLQHIFRKVGRGCLEQETGRGDQEAEEVAGTPGCLRSGRAGTREHPQEPEGQARKSRQEVVVA